MERLFPRATRVPMRDLIVVIVLFGALITSGIVSFLNKSSDTGAGVAYSTLSADPDGTLAIYDWLQAMGYPVQRLETVPYSVPAHWGALFVIAPSVSYTSGEAKSLAAWVRAGGTAIVALDYGDTALLHAFSALDISVPDAPDPSTLTVAQPLLDRPPIRRLSAPVAMGVTCINTTSCITYLESGRTPVLQGERIGRGHLFLFGAPRTFTNGSIRVADNRLLALNLLAELPAGATIGFDEFHHGVQTQQVQSATELLYTTPAGRALLYGAIIVFIYLLLSSRRLGKPIQENQPAARSIAEYIVSLAALYRRSGDRRDALTVVTRAFWQDIEETYHLDHVDSDARGATLVELCRARGIATDRQEAELLALLSIPTGEAIDEAELLRRVRALDALRDELGLARGRATGSR